MRIDLSLRDLCNINLYLIIISIRVYKSIYR